MEVPDKRVRKKSKRLSESEFAPEEPARKKRKLDKTTMPEPKSRKTLQKRKDKSIATEHHAHRLRKLVVSLKFAQHSLKLNNTPEAKGRNSNSREDTPSSASGVVTGERTPPRKNAELKFKNPRFSVSKMEQSFGSTRQQFQIAILGFRTSRVIEQQEKYCFWSNYVCSLPTLSI